MVEMFDRMDCLGNRFSVCRAVAPNAMRTVRSADAGRNTTGCSPSSNNTTKPSLGTLGTTAADRRHSRQDRQAEQRFKASRPQWRGAGRLEHTGRTTGHLGTLVATLLATITSESSTQEADRSILMKRSPQCGRVLARHAGNWTGVDRLGLEAHSSDLPQTGGPQPAGKWALQNWKRFVKPPRTTTGPKLKLRRATADFSNRYRNGATARKQRTGSALIDGTDDTTWNADRGIGRRQSTVRASCNSNANWTYPEGTQLEACLRPRNLGCAADQHHRNRPGSPPVDHARCGDPDRSRAAESGAAGRDLRRRRAGLAEAKLLKRRDRTPREIPASGGTSFCIWRACWRPMRAARIAWTRHWTSRCTRFSHTSPRRFILPRTRPQSVGSLVLADARVAADGRVSGEIASGSDVRRGAVETPRTLGRVRRFPNTGNCSIGSQSNLGSTAGARNT